MTYKNIFEEQVVEELINRINTLTPESKGEWGKMSVDQMFAHVNVAYDMAFSNKYDKPGGFKKFMLKLFVKNVVVGPKPYKKNNPTAPEFKMEGSKDFVAEKTRLIDYLNKTRDLGADHFDNRESHSFGPLSIDEWNTLFYKHLDHHLRQFGV